MVGMLCLSPIGIGLMWSLLSVRFNYKPGYKPRDLLKIQVLSLFEIFSPV